MIDILKNGRGEILNLMFQNPKQEYYLSEISKILGKNRGNYKKSLDSLVESNILIEERRGPLRYFKLNEGHFLYTEIKGILSKTIGIEFNLKKMINSIKGIEYAFIYGSVAQNSESNNSDIDLIIIGDSVDRDNLIDEVNKYQNKLKREINYKIFIKNEFLDKKENQDSFILNILNEPHINLKGDINDIKR